jgi:hypothetical protein
LPLVLTNISYALVLFHIEWPRKMRSSVKNSVVVPEQVTRLVREWKGRTHEVILTGDGCPVDGERQHP